MKNTATTKLSAAIPAVMVAAGACNTSDTATSGKCKRCDTNHLYVTSPIHTCDMTHLYMLHDCNTSDTATSAKWEIVGHIRDMSHYMLYASTKVLPCVWHDCNTSETATSPISRLLQSIGLFCKRALLKGLYSATSPKWDASVDHTWRII